MEKILAYLGNFGRYQAFLYALLILPGFLAGVQTLIFSWTGFVPNSRCRLPHEQLQEVQYSMSDADMKKWYVPGVSDGGSTAYCSYCPNATDETGACADPIECTDGFVYDRSQFTESLITKFDLVCGAKSLRDWARTVYQTGNLVGAIIFGILADTFGRRPVFIWSALAQIVVFNTMFLAPNFWVFCCYQFMNGFLQDGTYIAGYIVFMELVGGKARTYCGIWFQAFFTVGMLYDSLVAYIAQMLHGNWVIIQVAAGLPTLLYIPYWWLFPESIRWLAVRNQSDEAKKYLSRATKFNRIQIPDAIINEELSNTQEDRAGGTICDLFRHYNLAKISLIVFFTWFATSMLYYGLSFNTSDLPGDVYLTYTLSAISELPGFIICVPMMEKFGRKPSIVSLLGVGGISCIVAGFVKLSWVKVTLALVGKMCAAAAFAVAYNFSAELFPTVVRNIGTGMGSFSARIGGLLAPQVHSVTSKTAHWLPIVIYGSFALTAAFLDMFLPETLNRTLPETIEDGNNFGRSPATVAKSSVVVRTKDMEKNSSSSL
uniref:Major facilitator superfamily (MFS) profile domain-containing protein n=1 Tax=Plectus sambesii TaxID=2011161 RepID=A0A914W1A9_9BILA